MGPPCQLPGSSLRDAVLSKAPRARDFLVGAGVSIRAPSSLPSGDELSDLRGSSLLGDSPYAATVDEMMNDKAYRRLLPEAALQIIG